MRINLTQHNASPEQECTEPKNKKMVQKWLTFDTLPTLEEAQSRAWMLAQIAAEEGATEAMIGGAPFLMASLEHALTAHGIVPMYAFSVRESIETVNADGSVSKLAVFQHRGFVKV